MSVNIKVIYDDQTTDSFVFKSPAVRKTFLQRHRATTAILCDLKRNISNSRKLLPIHQKLRFSKATTFDDIFTNSVYPIVYCSKKQRFPTNTIVIQSWNNDEHKLSVDKDDTIIDVKFLLAEAINTKPEYIHFVINYKQRIFENSMNIIKRGMLTNNNDTPIIYWLEIPQINSNKPNEFVIRSQPQLLTIPSNINNIGKCFRYFTKKFAYNQHLGTRKWSLDNTQRKEYEYMTFNELSQNVSYLSTAFIRKLGLKFGTKIGLCSMNRSEWNMCDYAGHTQGFITVPLYDTLAKNAIEYIVNHASVSVIVCSKETLNEVVKAQKVCPTLKYIILMDLQNSDQQWIKKNNKSVGYTHTISQLLQFGKNNANNLVPDNYAKTDDLCTICYTSGTTGDPKGVLLTHKALLTSVVSLSIKLQEEIDEDTVHISYLPLAHMYEKLCELIILITGGSIAYWSGDVLTLLDDINECKPTVFMGVPRVYQKFQDKINMGVNESNFIRKFLFNKAWNSKVESIKNGTEPSALWEKLVFNKIKDRFGGRIKACVSGSAPLSANTANFLKACFSDIVAEGYGLTETSAAGTATHKMDNTYGQVGSVVNSVEMKLVDVTDMNYTINDEPMPRGEIWFRGPSLFNGYYKMDKKTEEVLTKDGWFATGDVGQWRIDGKLQIIDRKKNIFKLSQGEYIRPEYIENVYKLSAFVVNIF
eukprot:71691_1